MAKVIKIKQSEIIKIANNVINEQEFDDFDTKIQPEELPQEPELSNDNLFRKERGGFPMDSFMDEYDEYDELTLAKDNDGTFYILKNAQSGTPEIVAKAN